MSERVLNMSKICSFFGHRTIQDKEWLQSKVDTVVEDLIEKGFTHFLFGGFGEFDELCHAVVSVKKTKYPYIQRIYCVSDEKYLKEHNRPTYLRLEDYEEFTYYAPTFNYWYTRIYYRNCEMIKRSDYVVFYAESREGSGAYKALQYAQKQKKRYINLMVN